MHQVFVVSVNHQNSPVGWLLVIHFTEEKKCSSALRNLLDVTHQKQANKKKSMHKPGFPVFLVLCSFLHLYKHPFMGRKINLSHKI